MGNKGKVLAVDFGTKNVGLAMSDELGIAAATLEQIRNYSDTKLYKALSEIIQSNSIATILFGVPLMPNGEDTVLSQRIRKLGNKLSEGLKIKVIYWDEYLSSKQASQNKKKNIDSESAKIILQEFLNSVS